MRGGATAFFDDIGNGFHFGPRVTGLLVHLLNFLAIGEEFPFVQWLADFGRQFLAQLGVTEAFVPLEMDFGQTRLALDNVGKEDAIEGDVFCDADVIEQTGGVKVADIVIDRGALIRIADLDANIGPDQFIAH